MDCKKKYIYHIEDGQFSFDYSDTRLLGDEGDVIKVVNDIGDEVEVYILFVNEDYIECIGDVESSFPINWSEHMEQRKLVQELRKTDEEDEIEQEVQTGNLLLNDN